MEYNHRQIEAKWQKRWADNRTFRADNLSPKPKYYVLDMFPYPSGAGLHVGHPLGYIASDIFSRYKRHKGFNVLHPMGYDAFGLPAEQYAIETGQHPAITTEKNIARYREQLDKLGFSFDWDREFRTSDPAYYRWTQWIFAQLFTSWYNKASNKAEPITELITTFECSGNGQIQAACDEETKFFSSTEWSSFSAQEKSDILMKYRMAYQSFTWVNWCPALGTVLANDEVKDGVSERGGHPVERKMMRQWSLRITAYADRLLQGLDTLDWPESMKEIQRNWIGRSEGASIQFKVIPPDQLAHSVNTYSGAEGLEEKRINQAVAEVIEVFTTRPDTLFGVSFVTLAPEHELVGRLTTPAQKAEVDDYIAWAKNRSERERMTEVKKVSGVFTGAYVYHPFTGAKLPIWIGDYVLAGYGTGAVMAVPSGDQRDWNFATHFNIQLIPLFEGQDISVGAEESKDKRMINSYFLNGLTGKEAIPIAIKAIEEKGIGKGKVNFKLRDAGYSRQRYWGEPFPIVYKNGIPELLNFDQFPTLPEVKSYQPTGTGEGPLASVTDWVHMNAPDSEEIWKRETDTMPGYAGSSWYYLRYMDSLNEKEFVSKEASDYWKDVDLYIGGSEHATGHLMYVRFWTKFLKDLGYIQADEPARKLINQGMIQGRTSYVYQVFFLNMNLDFSHPVFVSKGIYDQFQKNKDTQALVTILTKELGISIPAVGHEGTSVGINPLRVDVRFVKNDELDIEAFKTWREDYKEAQFILENGKYSCGWEVEKMSKSKYNVVNPDDIVLEYGADTLRLYEMFLGPLEQSKPWNTNGITGVSGFLKKLWRLYLPILEGKEDRTEPSKSEWKIIHKTIKKVQEDIDRFSFNTSVSNFMICVNELSELKCSKRSILEPLLVLLSPYAPHITEELWEQLGHDSTIAFEPFPEFNPRHLEDDSFNYPISFNGKTRFNLELSVALTPKEIELAVLGHADASKWLEGNTPKKVIVVPKKIVNVVV